MQSQDGPPACAAAVAGRPSPLPGKCSVSDDDLGMQVGSATVPN